jgi:hypothetical protein
MITIMVLQMISGSILERLITMNLLFLHKMIVILKMRRMRHVLQFKTLMVTIWPISGF